MEQDAQLESNSPPTRQSRINAALDRVLQVRELTTLVPLLLVCIGVSLYNPVFLSYYNFISIARAVALTAIMTLGMTYVLIAKEIDLSVGSTLGLSGVMAGSLLVRGAPIWAGIVAGLLTGLVVGTLNGVMVVRLKIPSMIVTLGTMYMGRGLIYVITMGSPIYPMPAQLQEIGVGKIAGIPNAVYILVVMAVFAHFVLRRTIYGREVQAVGGDVEASRVTGIDVDRVRMSVFAVAGLCAGIAGVLMLGRLNSAEPGAGLNQEMIVIASTIIGGTSMFGGSGTIVGSMIGAALTGVLVSALVLLGIPAYWEKVVIGAIIILAVTIDYYQRRKLLRQG